MRYHVVITLPEDRATLDLSMLAEAVLLCVEPEDEAGAIVLTYQEGDAPDVAEPLTRWQTLVVWLHEHLFPRSFHDD